MDPRYKVVGVALLSVTVGLTRSLGDLLLVTFFLTFLAIKAVLPLGVFFKELRRFGMFILFTVIIQAWNHPGVPVFQLPGLRLAVTGEGLMAGLLFGWRLAAVLLVGLILTGTTLLRELRAAVYWLFKYIPGVPAGRIATMFSLILTLIPLVLDQTATISEAQTARGIENVKNPFKRLITLAWPVLRQTFRRADELVFAMESRCYSENPTQPVFVGMPQDPVRFSLVPFLMLLIWLI
ncbi:MAG TPA: energy-coupling factor transporter transmembrane component T, partial [Bacillota bacterium]|nr:energy-coupling factor transporter transmembrane component T [Bacillota bacterium]